MQDLEDLLVPRAKAMDGSKPTEGKNSPTHWPMLANVPVILLVNPWAQFNVLVLVYKGLNNLGIKNLKKWLGFTEGALAVIPVLVSVGQVTAWDRVLSVPPILWNPLPKWHQVVPCWPHLGTRWKLGLPRNIINILDDTIYISLKGAKPFFAQWLDYSLARFT